MARPRKSLRQRLMASVTVDETTGCWLRAGHRINGAYTQVALGGAQSRCVYAHRVSYELFVGSIPHGLTIDHLCRVPHCVNPAHLEPVTSRENTLRGTSFSATNARKTHCVHGHSLSDAYIVKATGHRRCRTCSTERHARWVASHREHKRAYDRKWIAARAAV